MDDRPDMTAAAVGYLAGRFALPYREGEHDCALLALGWIDALTGTRHQERVRGSYRTKFEGLRRHAAGGLTGGFRALLLSDGWVELADDEPLRAGDVVLTRGGSPGIFDGAAIVSAVQGCAGQVRMPETERREAFSWKPFTR